MTTWYRFATVFTIDVEPQRIWDALILPGGWLADHPDIEHWTAKARGGADHLGDRYGVDHHVGGPVTLRYDLEVVQSRAPYRLTWRVTGDLAGTAAFELDELDGVTDLRFTWEVATTKRWMNVAAPLIRRQMVREYKRSVVAAVNGLADAVGGRATRIRTSEGKQVPQATAIRFAAGLLVLAAVTPRRR